MSLDKVKQKLDEQMRQTYYGAQPQMPGHTYWYVLGFTKEKNRKVFWGPMSEDDAYKALSELNEGEKFGLTTRDPHRAVREVRDILIKRGESPDEALKKLLHKREEEKKPESMLSKLFKGRLTPKPAKGISRAELPPRRLLDRWHRE